MEKEKNQGTFYIIPTILAEEGNLTKAMLYGLISSLTNKFGFCFASNKYLAEKLNRTDKSNISKYISELEQESWIETKVDRKSGNKRQIWVIIGYKEKPQYYTEKTQEVLGKNTRGIVDIPKSYTEKTEDSNIRDKDKLKRKERKEAQPTAVPAQKKKSLVNLSSVEKKVEKVKVASGLTKEEIVVFSIYKEFVPVGFFKLTDKSVKESLPKAFKLFQEVFGDEAKDKFVDAIGLYCKDDWVKNDMQEKKGKYVPSKFFGETFIKNNIIPLVYNQNTNGRVPKREVSEKELRQISEDNQKRREEWMARHSRG